MTDEPANQTLALLREMRAEMRERFDAVDARLAAHETALAALSTAVGHLQGGQVALLDILGKQTRTLDEVALRSTLLEQRVSKVEPERV
jgi:hypothetical protein